MPVDYTTHLNAFDPDTLYDAALGFYHELYAFLSDLPEFDTIEITAQPDNPNARLHVNLKVQANCSIAGATAGLLRCWVSCLRYQSGVYENVEVNATETSAVVTAATVTDSSACTFRFELKK